jgi:diguanylate cyclase (GGDEF)-like protein
MEPSFAQIPLRLGHDDYQSATSIRYDRGTGQGGLVPIASGGAKRLDFRLRATGADWAGVRRVERCWPRYRRIFVPKRVSARGVAIAHIWPTHAIFAIAALVGFVAFGIWAAAFDIALWAFWLAIAVHHLRGVVREREELAGKLRERSERDDLVGLLNRATFTSRIQATLDAGAVPSVLFIDLDDFKVVNDTWGHNRGDAALVEIAGRITSTLYPPSVAGRLGGDEFGVLLPDGDVAAARAVARRLLSNLARPVSFDGRSTQIEASIGISAGSECQTAEELIREADVAMTIAKEQGKSRFVVFEAARHGGIIRRMGLRAELEQAIAAKQFMVVYQPIVTMPERKVSDCEALVRWQHPTRGLLAPAEFIDIAEETGLIVTLGRWLLNEACCQAAEWQERLGERAPGIAVNVSALQVRHPEFAADIRAALDQSGLDPRRLVVELTESVIIEVGSAMSLISKLSEIGVRIAIDDFGTGYSSLAYLAAYPVNVLKIDRSFVSGLESGQREARLISAIIALGKDLDLSVIAEGVETEEQCATLLEHGCKSFQGYFFAYPMLGHDLAPLLTGAATRGEPFGRGMLVPVEKTA